MEDSTNRINFCSRQRFKALNFENKNSELINVHVLKEGAAPSAILKVLFILSFVVALTKFPKLD